MGDIVLDGGGEKDGFLRHETDLATKPLDVKLLDIDAIQSNDTRQWIVEPLDQGDDSGLAGSGSTDQGNSGSCFDSQRKVFDDRDGGARRIAELDILEGDATFTALWLQPSRISRIDGGDPVESGKKLGSSTASVCDGLKLGCHKSQGEGTDENGNDDVNDFSSRS